MGHLFVFLCTEFVPSIWSEVYALPVSFTSPKPLLAQMMEQERAGVKIVTVDNVATPQIAPWVFPVYNL